MCAKIEKIYGSHMAVSHEFVFVTDTHGYPVTKIFPRWDSNPGRPGESRQ